MEALGTAVYLLAASAMGIGLVNLLFNLSWVMSKKPTVKLDLGIYLFVGGIIIMVLVPSKANAEPIPQPELSSMSYYTGGNMVIAQVAGHGLWAITVYTKDGKYKLTEFTNGCPRVEAIGDNCWEMPQTTDFVGIGGLPKDVGPFVPMVLCLVDSGMEAGLIDRTSVMLTKKLELRLEEITAMSSPCRAANFCMKADYSKAYMIEAMIIRDILIKEAPWHWKPSSWYGIENFIFNGLENEIARSLILRSWETDRPK